MPLVTAIEGTLTHEELFDDWPERYEAWFDSPIGRLVRKVEEETVFDLLGGVSGEHILDAGCGTGVFTSDIVASGAKVVGLDISHPMLRAATRKMPGEGFSAVEGDIGRLPFKDGVFTKAVSITALEFIEDAKTAVEELFRVTKPGGYILVATLNSLSPWAERRNAKTRRGQKHVLENAFYRSPDDLMALVPLPGVFRTAVHFQKDDDIASAQETEQRGRLRELKTGAFVAIRWQKPA